MRGGEKERYAVEIANRAESSAPTRLPLFLRKLRLSRQTFDSPRSGSTRDHDATGSSLTRKRMPCSYGERGELKVRFPCVCVCKSAWTCVCMCTCIAVTRRRETPMMRLHHQSEEILSAVNFITRKYDNPLSSGISNEKEL